MGENNTVLQGFVDSLAELLIIAGDLAKEFPILTGAVVALAAAFVALVAAAPFIAAFISILGSLKVALAGVALGATVAGWLGAVVPALAAIVAAFKAFAIGALAVITGPVGLTVLAVAGIVAMAIAFREPIMNFFNWLGGAIGDGLNALWQWGEPIREFWIGVWEAVKGVTNGFFDALIGIVSFGLQAAFAIVYQLLVQPWVNLWNNVLRGPVTAMLDWLSGIWDGVSQAFDQYVIQPISKAWNALIQLLPDAMRKAADFVVSVWTGLVDSVKGVINSLLRSVANAVNSVGSMVNTLIRAFNNLPGPNIPLVPTFSIPEFAKGGVVDKATLAMIGEGGEREYIVPESKMAAASSRYLAGARGSGVIPTSSSGGGGAVNSSQAPVINITTGPLMQFDGEEWVSRGDFEKGLQQVADAVLGRMRTPSARIALGRV
jgi:phage-related protein